MADQVSRMAWWIVGIFDEVADELFGVVSRAASSLQDERDKVDSGYLSNLVFSALLAM